METCTPRSKRSPRRSREDGSEGDAGQGVWEWRREITLHGPHGTRARALRPGPLHFGDGPTHVGPTDVTCCAGARRRTNRCLHMRDTKPSEETSDTVQISNVQYNETRRETAAECCAIRQWSEGVRRRARAGTRGTAAPLVDLSPPGPVDARATRDVYGSAKRRPAVRRWESPERDRRAFELSDSLSNVADVTRMAARVPATAADPLRHTVRTPKVDRAGEPAGSN
jgi:hypothetical protein